MTTHDYFDYEIQEPLIYFDTLPFNKAIRLKRLAEGFTQVQLGQLLQCSPTSINLFEQGKRALPAKCLERAKRYLYVDIYIDGVLKSNG